MLVVHANLEHVCHHDWPIRFVLLEKRYVSNVEKFWKNKFSKKKMMDSNEKMTALVPRWEELIRNNDTFRFLIGKHSGRTKFCMIPHSSYHLKHTCLWFVLPSPHLILHQLSIYSWFFFFNHFGHFEIEN